MNIKATSNLSPATTTIRPHQITWIVILMLLTMMRFFMFTQLPSLQMFGGVNPDAWLAPWVSDTILGALVPLMIFLALRKRGIKIWGVLLIYNAVGAFDYVHGLVTQWTDPLVPSGMLGTPELTFGSIGFSLIVQLVALYFLFRANVISYLTSSSRQDDMA